MEFLWDLTADGLFAGTALAVFVAAAMLWFVVARAAQGAIEDYQETFTATASANMSDMFLFIDPARLFVINLVAMVLLPLLVWLLTRDVPATLVMLGLVVVLPSFFYRRMRAQRLKRIEAQLPDALAMVAGSMRAGASLNIALESMVREQAPPITQEFELFLKEQRLGVDFEVSMAHMEARIPLQDFSMLVTALRINREVGGNLADTIESLGETLRRKAMMEGKIRSLTAQGKLQGIVMTGLPVLLGVLLNFMEPEAMSQLWTTPMGWAVLGVIIVMEALGFFMIRKITTIDV